MKAALHGTRQGKFREVRSLDGKEYDFDEVQFNDLGHRLMGEGKNAETIAVFRMNGESFPKSWNVYDSLGEAYLNSGMKDLAVENYRKSLKLNPGNAFAKEVHERLAGDG